MVREHPADQKTNYTNFTLKVQFKALKLPNHRVITCEFTDRTAIDVDCTQSRNIVREGHALTLNGRMRAASACCAWRVRGDTTQPTELRLVLSRNGKIVDRFSLFGKPTSEWSRVFTTFDSSSRFIRNAENGDQLTIE